METCPAWRTQIYKLSDATAQRLIANVLQNVDGVIAITTVDHDDHFVIVQCRDRKRARSVHRMVTFADRFAELTHRATGTMAPRYAEDAPA